MNAYSPGLNFFDRDLIWTSSETEIKTAVLKERFPGIGLPKHGRFRRENHRVFVLKDLEILLSGRTMTVSQVGKLSLVFRITGGSGDLV